MSAKELTPESQMLYAVAWYHRERNTSTPPSISHIARACQVPYSTLKHQMKGWKTTKEVAESRLKLTIGEEAAIVANCQILSSWLQPPRVSLVSKMALCLLQKRKSPMETKPSNGLGLCWVNPGLSLGWAGFIGLGSLNSFPGHPKNPMNVSPQFLAFDRPHLFVSPGK